MRLGSWSEVMEIGMLKKTTDMKVLQVAFAWICPT